MSLTSQQAAAVADLMCHLDSMACDYPSLRLSGGWVWFDGDIHGRIDWDSTIEAHVFEEGG